MQPAQAAHNEEPSPSHGTVGLQEALPSCGPAGGLRRQDLCVPHRAAVDAQLHLHSGASGAVFPNGSERLCIPGKQRAPTRSPHQVHGVGPHPSGVLEGGLHLKLLARRGDDIGIAALSSDLGQRLAAAVLHHRKLKVAQPHVGAGG